MTRYIGTTVEPGGRIAGRRSSPYSGLQPRASLEPHCPPLQMEILAVPPKNVTRTAHVQPTSRRKNNHPGAAGESPDTARALEVRTDCEHDDPVEPQVLTTVRDPPGTGRVRRITRGQ